MFKNRHFEVKLKKDQPATEVESALFDSPAATFSMNPTQLSETATEFVTNTAVTVVTAYTAMRIVRTVCKIAELAAKAALK